MRPKALGRPPLAMSAGKEDGREKEYNGLGLNVILYILLCLLEIP